MQNAGNIKIIIVVWYRRIPVHLSSLVPLTSERRHSESERPSRDTNTLADLVATPGIKMHIPNKNLRINNSTRSNNHPRSLHLFRSMLI